MRTEVASQMIYSFLFSRLSFMNIWLTRINLCIIKAHGRHLIHVLLYSHINFPTRLFSKLSLHLIDCLHTQRPAQTDGKSARILIN